MIPIVVSKTATAIAVIILHSVLLFKILLIAQIAVMGALINSCNPIEISI